MYAVVREFHISHLFATIPTRNNKNDLLIFFLFQQKQEIIYSFLFAAKSMQYEEAFVRESASVCARVCVGYLL